MAEQAASAEGCRRSRASGRSAGPAGPHISDISVTGSGRIIVSSAADAGDDGPFDSAIGEAGRVTVPADGRVRVTLAAPRIVLGTFRQYKVEAVECLPGSTDALLGTDDENLGGYVRSMPFCRAWPGRHTQPSSEPLDLERRRNSPRSSCQGLALPSARP
ncbi:hypothetical protein ACWEF9_28385 [Streptomyces sp. NPDC004980]